ncbi:heme lyase CcmF/NrfE family subunit [Ferrovibrio terrae]|uniref:Heme lyase CcmF/NrfE family subunit n=1 Tax=Ferrovibrio terrae TaxID=2594003 RepID=A0A516H1U9_9PROT|nr:heme lyase CcmF/NrfE family subunit [Ferrovibrio terrae]QDO97743.1 heme lyase CcmF/NrfE family subunit [Ferrovibrio terrae]
MIPELGHIALILALCLALVQGVLPLVGAARGMPGWIALGPQAALGQAVLVAFAFGCLTYAYVTSDFSVLNVAENSHTLKPMLYKFSGVWGNHEGSLLLWILILVIFGAAVAAFGGNLPATLKARVLGIQGLIGVGFLSFILFTSNPFARLLPTPLEGRGLNPLLQDPGLAFHPPFLYLGYVGFSVAFSFAVAALIEGRVDPAWARWVRPWTLAAWCFLTIGIALGSWWAYYELGWGGWWFWDPVENASFMPWLAGTALLHSAVVVEKRDTLKSWTVLLAILTFSLSLLGTFLVRSGVINSVHAFATDPTRGVFILIFLVLVVGGSLVLYAFRAPVLQGVGVFAPLSREGALVLNNLLLAVACAAVLLGTLYPIALDAINGAKVSVGPQYFNAVFIPLTAPLVAAVAIGPLLAWKRGDLSAALRRLLPAAVAMLIALSIGLWLIDGRSFMALLGLGLTAWLGIGTLCELSLRLKLFAAPVSETLSRARHLPRAAWGMTVAHLGVALLVMGITVSETWQVEVQQVMKPGETVQVGPVQYRFLGVAPYKGPNYTAQRGRFEILEDGRVVHELRPAQRRYQQPPMETTEAAIRPSLLGDLYAVVGEGDAGRGWAVRLYWKPLVSWIWLGALIMALGGFLSLSDRRLRVGAPARRRSEAAAPAE